MVTASHNPKEDNGYKLYWENGAQIIPPHDGNISKVISENLKLIDLSENFDYFHKTVCYKYDNFTESTIKDYIDSLIKKYTFNSREVNKKCPSITYTAMHGVGFPFFSRSMAALGFSQLNLTAE